MPAAAVEVPGVELEDVCCPLGCNRNDEFVLTGRDHLHGLPGEYRIVRCRTCGLMRTNPRPTQATMSFYYPDDYGPYVGTRVTPPRPRFKRLPGLRRTVKRFFQFNLDRLPAIPVGRMLEIGCASGAFMHGMAAQGWHVEGIEFSPVAAAAAASLGYRVFAGPLEDAPPPAEPFDLIVGWMVLEHLHRPVHALRKLSGWIRPGGYLVLSVPNAGAIDSKIFGSDWYALHLPNHLYHYTRQSIRRMLDASGWQLDRIHFQRTLVDPVASFGYVLRRRGMTKLSEPLIRFPEYPGLWIYGLYPLATMMAALGQTGRMTVWARKAP